MTTQVIIDEVVSRVRALDGGSALSPETLRQIVEAVLPAVQAMLAHDHRVGRERALDNGYADRLGGGQS